MKSKTIIIIASLGVVGVILMVVANNWEKIFGDEDNVEVGTTEPNHEYPYKPKPEPQAVVPILDPLKYTEEWDKIMMDDFESVETEWVVGDYENEYVDPFDIQIKNGKLRWDMLYQKPGLFFLESPKGMSAGFYVAADVKFIESGSANKSAGLLFGKILVHNYIFLINEHNQYFVSYFDGEKVENHIPYTSFDKNPEGTYRLAILSENLILRFYINGAQVGDLRFDFFAGGHVGVALQSIDTGAMVVEFDNFEYRRR
ncbi:MAG: hypothetical protein IIA45_04765 [Bacteroidetes bacterium]|nr:hypothetical protein [Bacteroidota bacterium]